MTPKRGDDVAPPPVGGRVRYLVDEPRRTVHLVYAAPRHPKDTD
ncbi:hypothetical protein [Streptomyces sp. NPDC093795]